MGLDMSVTVAAGLLVKYNDLWKEKRQKNCDCNVDDYDNKFCQDCGKPVMTGQDIPLNQYNDEEGTFADFKIIYSQADYNTVLICLAYAKTGEVFVKLPNDSEAHKKKLKEVAEKAGIWNEDNFGIWAANTSGW